MAPFHAAVLAYTAVVLLAAASQGALGPASYEQYAATFAPIYFISLPFLAGVVRALLWRLEPGRRPLRKIAADLPGASGQLASAAVTLMSLILFMGSFTTFKTLMPILMGGFPHDRAQAGIDAWLHFGADPGPALLGFIGSPQVLTVLHWNYMVGWMALAFLPAFFIATRREAEGIRLRYFLTFAAVWAVLGSLLACLFLSAGPAFYANVTGDAGRFGPQMDALLAAVGPTHQPYLWENYVKGTVGLGTGISAFPSVHVGVAAMNAFFLWDMNRKAGMLGLAYLAVVAASSVVLGWHYAIDGYVSVAVVWLLHVTLKRLLAGRGTQTILPSPSPATP